LSFVLRRVDIEPSSKLKVQSTKFKAQEGHMTVLDVVILLIVAGFVVRWGRQLVVTRVVVVWCRLRLDSLARFGNVVARQLGLPELFAVNIATQSFRSSGRS
jgi:hypothetical protein